jgi:succinate dehydrogenase / fumarate reductase membrane anchor subunit
MVTSVTNCTRNGLGDWLLQRVSALVMGAYAIFLVVFFVLHCPMTYATWKSLFSCLWFELATTVVLFSLLGHAWVGIWTVFTDYIKCASLRVVLEVLLILFLLVLAIAGCWIVWS